MSEAIRDPQAWCLVIDQGGHSTRALVFDIFGNVHANVAVPVKTFISKDGYIEQDPAELLASVTVVIEQIAVLLGHQCQRVKRAGLIVQRSSLLAWNKITRELISPVLSWQDTRNEHWLQMHMANHETWLQALTGLRANAHYGASKIRWLLDHHVAVQNYPGDALCIGPLSAFLTQQLTQSSEPCVDAVIASRTMLTEIGSDHWSATLLDFFAIPRTVLPAMKHTMATYGVFALGEASVPLVLQGGDQSFIAFAQGESLLQDSIFINAGTGAFIQRAMCSDSVPAGLLCSPLMINGSQGSDANVLVAEGTVNAAATALDWLWDVHGKRLSEENLEEALRDAALVPIFINTVTATGSPDWLPAAPPVFSFAADLATEAVAVIESIVFALQRNISLLQSAKPAVRIVLSGGLSRLQGFCQRLADISELPVCCSDDAEASARGAAYCLQHAPACWEMLPLRTFHPCSHAAMLARYQEWTLLMSARLSSSGK